MAMRPGSPSYIMASNEMLFSSLKLGGWFFKWFVNCVFSFLVDALVVNRKVFAKDILTVQL